MALISWDNSLSVKVSEIDGQHKQLIKMINDLNDAMKARKGSEVLGKIITGLVDYAIQHFTLEEKYFEKFGYSAAVTHKMEHEKFIKRVAEFKGEFESGKLMLTIEVMDFLKDWLIKHIKGTDQKYSAFFNEHGLT